MAAKPAGALPAGFERAQAVADAVLYEGYLLYPYRGSSPKNRVRWQFGVLAPKAWAVANGLTDESVAGSAESWWQRTECLLDTPGDAVVDLRVRFLQLQRKSVAERAADGSYQPASRVDTGSRLEVGFDEAVPRHFDATVSVASVLAAPRRFSIRAPAGQQSEALAGDDGKPAGRVLRRRWPVEASVTLSAQRCEAAGQATAGLLRLQARIENNGAAASPGASRDEALRGSLVACHLLLGVRGGSFLSLLDPPAWAEPAVRACANVHTFPVLAGPPGSRDLILSSPILLYDHPLIAPESPGDLHDATEIDEILSLRTLTLTDAEKREARGTDPRAAAILDRVDSMPPEVMSRLHGAFRSLPPATGSPDGTRSPDGSTGAARADGTGSADGSTGAASADGAGGTARTRAEDGPGPPSVPWWDPGADSSVSPDTDGVVVAGTRLSKGSRVRLRPRPHGTDPQDMFLDGRPARVEAVLLDVDGAWSLAVTLEDDPAAELNQWYGRYRYFSPDEVEPLVPADEVRHPAGGRHD